MHDIPEDYKRLALSMLDDQKLMEVLNNPRVDEARKVEVRAEIERRKLR